MPSELTIHHSSPFSHCTPDDLLGILAPEFGDCRNLELEFSLRLACGRVQNSGRFACWVNGSRAQDFFCVERVLSRLGAPPPVPVEQRNQQFPVRQAIAASLDDAGVEFRLYLHARDPHTFADRYHGWRWRAGEAPRRSDYVFHFMPETASGTRPIHLVNEELRPAFELLLEEPLLEQMSGFWLRYDEWGRVDQLDIALPWHPTAGTIRPLPELVRLLGIADEKFTPWRELPIRHVAVPGSGESPAVTLYASATLTSPFPTTEHQLQACVFENSTTTHHAIEQEILRRLPPSAQAGNGDLGRFYDGSIATWQAVLGPEMHYHAGIFESTDMDPSDDAMTHALRRAVNELYPFLPAGGSIYDLGCGWGGPLEMFIRDLRCHSLGITISRRQFQYVAAHGLPVRWGDAENTLPPGQFDCIVLLESLSHIRDKQRLLRMLRLFTSRLVMRVNCQDSQPPSDAFGGSMHMIRSSDLREAVEEAGWRIVHWRDRRREALPSVAVWHRRLRSLPRGSDQHLEIFRAWCARVMSFSNEWAAHNPLIEVVADRSRSIQ